MDSVLMMPYSGRCVPEPSSPAAVARPPSSSDRLSDGLSASSCGPRQPQFRRDLNPIALRPDTGAARRGSPRGSVSVDRKAADQEARDGHAEGSVAPVYRLGDRNRETEYVNCRTRGLPKGGMRQVFLDRFQVVGPAKPRVARGAAFWAHRSGAAGEGAPVALRRAPLPPGRRHTAPRRVLAGGTERRHTVARRHGGHRVLRSTDVQGLRISPAAGSEGGGLREVQGFEG